MPGNAMRVAFDKVALGAEAPAGPARRYRCRFVRAGRVRAAGNQPGPLILEASALEQACQAGLFDGRAVFVDHAAWLESPSLRNLVGVTGQAAWDASEQAVHGVVELLPGGEALAELLDEIVARQAPDVGLSLVFWPEFAGEPGPHGERRVAGIRHIESVDLVFEPAAGGRILQALSSAAWWAGSQLAAQSNRAGEQLAPQADRAGEQLALQKINAQGEHLMSEAQIEQSVAPGEQEGAQDWQLAVARSAASLLVAASGLPAASQQRLLTQTYAHPGEVEQAIRNEQQYLAALQEHNAIQLPGRAPRSPHIQVGLSGLEQVQAAAEALFLGRRPEQGIPPLAGIRELYTLLSGDYEMAGVFHPERVRLANVDSSSMAGLVANALNKAVVNLFQEYPRWWEPLVMQENFATLQQVKWITLGGVGELPTVSEGAAYTELTWDDLTETSDFTKKGGYLGITLEAIDKDDTRRIQAAPRALAQSAWLTLSKSISNIFTSNSGVGPTLSDGLALFHSSHGNLGSTALTLSSYAAARTAMRKQTELNSGERLGALTAPKYLLVPPDLEITALQVLASQYDYSYALSNGTAAPDNAFAEGSDREARFNSARRRVIVVDLWTDSNNWAACADPRLYPTIGLGFRYGPTPEVFSVASPTAGLMFTNDTLPVKVRFFYAVGPVDYRGLYKANVA